MISETIVKPYFEGLLQGLDNEGQKIQADSLLQINGDTRLKDLLGQVDLALRTISGVIFEHDTKIENERTIQYLGCRLFNTCSSAIKLGVFGYYQSGFSTIRDLVETGFLLDYFTLDPTKIEDWRTADNSVRQSIFAPRIVREKLDQRDQFKEGKRRKVYQALCECATHPSFSGFSLIATKGLVKIGPFYDSTLLTTLIEELFLRFPIVVLYFLENLKNLPASTLSLRHEFLKSLNEINVKYLGKPENSKVNEIGLLLEYAKEQKYF